MINGFFSDLRQVFSPQFFQDFRAKTIKLQVNLKIRHVRCQLLYKTNVLCNTDTIGIYH
ncbi:hypothetical protein D3C87_1319010 [compost metagenome]